MENPLVYSVKERLLSFGYEVQKEDEYAVEFAVNKVTEYIKNNCNVEEVPEGLFYIAVDMSAGEFLYNKRVFSPSSLNVLNADEIVKTLSIGDVSIGYGDNAESSDDKLKSVINYLLNHGKEQFSCYRRLRW